MQLNMSAVVLLSVAILFCSALGHPSQQIDKDTTIKSVKSSSGRSALEAESESEVSSSRIELEKNGNDVVSRSSDYEASTASESSHSSTNSETEFATMDLDDGDKSISELNNRTEVTSSTSTSSKTKFEEEMISTGQNSLNDDFEMSYASASEKSEKSSPSSSQTSDINALLLENEKDNVEHESFSSTTKENEIEAEKVEKSFVSKNIEYNVEGIQKETSKIVEKEKSVASTIQAQDVSPKLEETENSIASTVQRQKLEVEEKSTNATTQKQDIDTRIGTPENSIPKGSKNVSSVKKSAVNAKGIPKNEKHSKASQKASQKASKSQKPKGSSAQNKKVESETVQKSSATNAPVQNSTIPSNSSSEGNKQVEEIKSASESEINIYENSQNFYSSAVEKSNPLVPNAPQAAAEEVISSSSDKKSMEKESMSMTNNSTSDVQIENQMKEQEVAVNQTTCVPGSSPLSIPSTLPETTLPGNEIGNEMPKSSSPQLPVVCEESSSPQSGIPPTPPASTAESSVQTTSTTCKDTTSEKKLTDSSTQYNSNSDLYAPYPQYPMYSYENSPFLAPLDKFPNGQPNYPSHLPQPSNMNYFNSPCNLYLGGYIPAPYPLYAYPPPGFTPFYLQPKCQNNPNNPCSNIPLQYPPTSSLPTPQTLPLMPRSTPQDSNIDNFPRKSVTDTVPPVNLPTPDLVEFPSLPPSVESIAVTDIKQKELDIIENPTAIPTTLPTTPSAIETISAMPQQPLSPSQELMVKNHLPPYIIQDLEQRFEEAKTVILQRYTVYPKDMTEIIETADDTTLCYDYLVLGTHVGGLTALKSLTETGKRVLILDDARLPPSESYSHYHRLGLINSEYVTSYSAKAAKTDAEKKIRVSKVVGGTLSYDLGVWDHGAAQKFAQWSQTCKAWSWDKVSSYYRDLENVEDIGYLNGPISVSHNVPDCSLAENIINSFAESDIHEESYEIDSARSEPGLILLPSMYDNKAGMNFAEKMFAEVEGRENLHMALGLQAVKIVFESDRAVGVEVVTVSGKTRVIRVTEELIISHGVVNTVKLLQLSGFGDASLLQQHQISVLRDLPQLGKDVLVYPMYPGVFIKCSRGTLLDASESDFSALGYAFKETNVPTSFATSFYKAFLQVRGASESSIQINMYTFSSRTTERLMYFMQGLFNFNQETIDFVLREVADHDIMFLLPQLLDVEVRAQVSISSADYKAAPVIDTHLFESDDDLLVMQKTLTVIKKISKSSVFKEIGGELVQIPVAKCGPTTFSKAFNECSIRELTVASLHLTGGAVMGVDERMSVVDEQLRLRGTQNVRLLNAAVIPNGVSTDSSAISSVIGRYGADMIVKKV